MGFTSLVASNVGSKGRRGRWGTPTLAIHIRIQHREETDNESQIRQSQAATPSGPLGPLIILLVDVTV